MKIKKNRSIIIFENLFQKKHGIGGVKLEDRGKILGKELHQMIDVNYQANIILDSAKEKAQKIAEQTEKEKQEFIEKIQADNVQVKEKAKKEQEAILLQKEQEIQANFESLKQSLSQQIEQGKEQWMHSMLQEIIGI